MEIGRAIFLGPNFFPPEKLGLRKKTQNHNRVPPPKQFQETELFWKKKHKRAHRTSRCPT